MRGEEWSRRSRVAVHGRAAATAAGRIITAGRASRGVGEEEENDGQPHAADDPAGNSTHGYVLPLLPIRHPAIRIVAVAWERCGFETTVSLYPKTGQAVARNEAGTSCYHFAIQLGSMG